MMGEGGSISKGPDSAQNVSFKTLDDGHFTLVSCYTPPLIQYHSN